MDNRKDALRSVKMCRFCLTEDTKLSNLYDRSRVPKNAVTLPLQILACVSIEVFPSDGMPTQICDRCRFFMDISYHFKQICRQAEESIMQFLENGEPLEPVTWPSKLLKLFPSNTESVGGNEVVKTLVTESGTCVQVQTDSEEDGNTDEKVYNIKIESDGSQSLKKGSSFRVITGDEKIQLVNNDIPTKEKKGGAGGGTASASAERWPCDDCDRTYPLRQLLELHRAQKHRRREVVCNICGDQFFTKYDLMTHQLRHSSDMPFECVACNRKFNRLVLLKRHEKAKHPELPRYYCQDCPLNFLSVEEFQAHKLRHKQYAVRPHTCEICKKKFHTNRALSRHKETVHGRNLPYACELCPQRYSTGPKLARHVRTHSRGSEYPCKFCSKVFYKSHHYTRHLRLKHKDSGRASRNTVNDSNNYRCDQCEEAFSTQDDLIYHSAYHATQNLICPLCQDKFEDVDAVTTHIKSHVDSEQYMCDLCELVFTSQERLDIHVATKHEDELREEQLQESDHAEEDSMDMEPDEEGDEDQNFSLKEEGDHMVVEIKKPNEFAVTNVVQVPDGKSNKISEGNENEMTYTELATVDTLAIAKQQQQAVKAKQSVNAKLKHVTNKQVVTASPVVVKSVANTSNETTLIVQKAEEIKRKYLEQKEMRSQPSNKELKSEKKESTSSSTGTSDKSLRLLEKELRELQRTSNARNESGKSTTPTAESMRGRRLQIHTSTPKLRNIESKKILVSGKTVEKRSLERIPVVAKENKECKENRDSKNNNTSFKEEKEPKDQKFKEQKVRNGIEKAASEESARRPSRDDSVRRSSRPSKIRDYAKMIREGTQVSDNDDDDYESEDDDEEYGEDAESEVHQPRGRLRRAPAKPAVVPAKPADSAPANAPRKRGRPRKIDKKRPPSPEITKTKKLKQEPEQGVEEGNNKSQHQVKKTEEKDQSSENDNAAIIEQKVISDKNTAEEKSPPSTPTSGTTGEGKGSPMLLSPSGQTLKKIPIKALPPGIKPLPLPANARPVGQLCEMQIGEKVMKVQKIVMTKEKVEQLAKQGLIEVKAGTMVLKTGYKLASSGDSPVKGTPSTPDGNKESPLKRDKPTPTRCDLQEES